MKTAPPATANAHSCLEKLRSPRMTLAATNKKQMIVIAISVQLPCWAPYSRHPVARGAQRSEQEPRKRVRSNLASEGLDDVDDRRDDRHRNRKNPECVFPVVRDLHEAPRRERVKPGRPSGRQTHLSRTP